jgi:hypothetical protein
VGSPDAAPTVAFNTNVEAWNVGSGQSNRALAVTRDTTTAVGFDIELGLRAQQRFVGAITPDDGNFSSAPFPRIQALHWHCGVSTIQQPQKPNGETPNLSEILNSQLYLDLITNNGATAQVDLLNPLGLNLPPSGSLEITNYYVQLANP